MACFTLVLVWTDAIKEREVPLRGPSASRIHLWLTLG